ncbi:hypothetical protein D3C72_1128040 [compost metagenome]
MQFNLISSDVVGTDRRDRLLHQLDGEVGNTDLSGQAQTLGFEQGAHKLFDRHLVFRRRPVNQRQVEVVGLQFLQAFLEAVDQAILGEVGDPDLAGDEQLFARYAAGCDGLADVGFVFVDLRGVDGPVA